jgi:hypothetical protein
MACVSPQTVNATLTHGGSTAIISLTHCDDADFMVLKAEFSPKKVGASVTVQGMIKIDGQDWKFATGTVIFNDDDTVTNYGDTANGVRFQQKRFDMRKPHIAKVVGSMIA